MKKKEIISIAYNQIDSPDDVSSSDKLLLDRAILASKSAYAPYSQFKVGAALLLENGEFIIGSNQENIAYPSGLCAERVALFAASANFPDIRIEALGIFAEKAETPESIISPCGSCRQVMQEYEVKQEGMIRVLLMNPSGKVWEFDSCSDLLPFAFSYQPLKKS